MRRLFFKFTAGLCLLSLMVSCSSDSDSEPNSGSFKGLNKNIPVTDDIELTRAEKEANDGINTFGFRLLNKAATDPKRLDKDNGNVAVSSLSASMALAMLANSADEAVETAISDMLGETDLNSLNSTCNKLMRFLPSSKNGGHFTLANSVWYNTIINPLSSWKKNLSEVFYAETGALDFSKPENVNVINTWCSDYTNGLINNVLDQLDQQTVAYLINAMYFLGTWDSKFDRENTKERRFKGRDATVKHDMMHDTKDLGYVCADKFEMVSLPFDGNSRMLLLLPKKGTDAQSLASTLTCDDINSAKMQLCGHEVELVLPKFKIETSIDISDYLVEMGLPPVCRPEKMGFDRDVALSTCQFTSTSVNEDGAEVAVVTITGIDLTALGPSTRVKVEFTRPFIYLIENTVTGTILITGLVNNL